MARKKKPQPSQEERDLLDCLNQAFIAFGRIRTAGRTLADAKVHREIAVDGVRSIVAQGLDLLEKAGELDPPKATPLPTAAEKGARRGLRVIDGGKTIDSADPDATLRLGGSTS